jgi:hypothetical protein
MRYQARGRMRMRPMHARAAQKSDGPSAPRRSMLAVPGPGPNTTTPASSPSGVRKP